VDAWTELSLDWGEWPPILVFQLLKTVASYAMKDFNAHPLTRGCKDLGIVGQVFIRDMLPAF